MDKPQLPRTASYRHPDTGKFIKKQEWEELAQVGKRGSVTMSAAVSNKQIKQYIDMLSHQSFGQGLAQSYERNDTGGIKTDEMEKLFDTIATKIVNKIGGIQTNINEIKKQNDQHATRLINLSTSMLSTMTSQKDTINELYKIIDKRLSMGNSVGDKKDDKVIKNEPELKSAGIIRGLGGLNKLLVELNKTVSSKVFPTLLNIQKQLGDAKPQIKPIDTTKPTAATPAIEQEKIQPSKTIAKKDEKAAYSQSNIEMFGTGLKSLLAGSGIIALGGSIDSLTKKIENLPQYISGKIGETAKSGAKAGFEKLTSLAPNSEQFQQFFKDTPNWFEQYSSELGKDFSQVGETWSAEGWKKDVSEMKEVFGSVSSMFKLFVDDISYIKTYAEKSGLFDSLRSMIGLDSGEKPVKVAKEKDVTPSMSTPEQHEQIVKERQANKNPSIQKKDKPPKNVNPNVPGIHRLDFYKKEPIGELSIINEATKPIVPNVVRNSLTPTTNSIKESTLALQTARQELTQQGAIKQIHPQVSVNNQTNNNQHVGILNNPSARNSESSKAMLDKMVLFGGYTGTGFLVN